MTPDELAAAEEAGRLPPLLHFWRPDPQPGDRPGPGCLSQWWPAPFTVDGVGFPTAEHYMMWRKALLFGDERAGAMVLADPDPAAAKAAGRTVAGFDGPRWVVHRFDIVVDGNRAKFAADAALRGYLVGTGGHVLVEASPDDAVWGIGLAADDPDAAVPSRWHGYNLLGFALMQVRGELAGC